MKRRIQLDSDVACRIELERCSTGIAELDHVFTHARIALDEAEKAWEEYEAEAAEESRRPDDKGLTATEVKARIGAWVRANKAASEAREHLRSCERNLDLIDRWYRSLEKRASNAQSALKQHQGEAHFGGYGRTG